jgi:hypothetical protein
VLSEFPTLSMIACPTILPAVLQQWAVQQALHIVQARSYLNFHQGEMAELDLVITLNALRTTATSIKKLQIPVPVAFSNAFKRQYLKI